MKRRWFLCAAIILWTASITSAQTASGAIQGTISDQSGAIIIGARLTLTEQQTNQERSQTTDGSGLYHFRALPPGIYRLDVEQSRFAKQTVLHIPLQVAEIRTIDLSLNPGTLEQSVTVESSAQMLQVADSSLSQVIDQARVQELPLNGRNMLQLTSLAAGAVVSAKGSGTERQAYYGPGFSIGGQRDNANTVLVNGIEISGMELNNYPLAIPSLDAVQEFRVQTSNYPAEFGGNSGAAINVATKRGTNEMHGVLFEFLRNNNIMARNFFNPSITPLHRNQFGFTAGGPVYLPRIHKGRNKTFWLFSYEGIRQSNAITSTALVPTLDQRSGSFASSGVVVVDPFSRRPLANNLIPPSLINPLGKRLLEEYPTPNSPDPAANYIGSPTQSFNNGLYNGRVDRQLPQKDSFFGVFTINAPKTTSPGATQAFSGYNQIQHDWNLQAMVGNTWIISPHVVNETNLGFVRFERPRGSQAAGVLDYVKEWGIQIPDPPSYAWAVPMVRAAGLADVGYGDGNAVLYWVSQSSQVVDNLSVERGSHTLKMGFTLNNKRLSSTQFAQPNGIYSFNGMFSALNPAQQTTAANAVADILLGYPSAYSLQSQPYLQRFHYVNLGAYFQDDWKVTRNLTMNLGLRWEYFGKPTDRHDAIGSFDEATGQRLLPGQNGLPRSLVFPAYRDFGPRVGFAWRVPGSSKLSLRGGYGIFYAPEVINSFRNLGFQNPFGATYSLTVRPVDANAPVPQFTVENPIAGASALATTNTVNGIDPHFKDAMVGQWNLTAQYLFSPSTMIEVAYRGSKSTHLSSAFNYNQTNPNPPQPPNFALIFPWPQFGSIRIFKSIGDALYNALQARIEKRYSKGFTILGSYTWLKDLSDVSASSVGVSASPGNSFVPQDVHNLAANRGNAVGDRPQQLVVSGIWDIPLLKGHSQWERRLIGGWQLSGTYTAALGSWLTPSSFGVSYVGSRPNYLCDPNLPRSQRTPAAYFKVSCLANPAPGQLGNAGTGTIQGSGINLWNAGLIKKFQVTEKQYIQFRTEVFNLFNHPQFDDPYVYPGNNPQAGKITSASDYGYNPSERIIQFGLKIHF
jgi:hypothetical protein